MKKLFTAKSALFALLVTLPLSLQAQTAADVSKGIGTFDSIITKVTETVVKSTASLLLALALLAFFWGIVEYIWAKRSGDAKGVADGSKFMVSGLIALFVMFSVYGIVKFAQGTLFGNADMTSITIPNINFGGSSNSSINKTNPLGGNPNSGANNTNPVGGSSQSSFSACIANGNSAAQCAAQAAASNSGTQDQSSPVGGGSTSGGSTYNPAQDSQAANVPDCGSYTSKGSGACAQVAGCMWESMGSAGGTCIASSD